MGIESEKQVGCVWKVNTSIAIKHVFSSSFKLKHVSQGKSDSERCGSVRVGAAKPLAKSSFMNDVLTTVRV